VNTNNEPRADTSEERRSEPPADATSTAYIRLHTSAMDAALIVKIAIFVALVALIILAILLAFLRAKQARAERAYSAAGKLGGGDVRVLLLGERPSAATPAVIFIGGLGRADDDHIAEWNFDENAGAAARARFRYAAPTWGVQPMVARYTATLSFDWPGVGGTPAGDPEKLPRTMEEEAAFVRGLAEAHGLAPPFVIVGMSMGAKTALTMLLSRPAEVRAAVLIDPAPFSALSAADAPPSAEYSAEFPTAAARIRAAVASRDRFAMDEIRAADNIVVHLDLVPNDAPLEVRERNVRSVCENEALFKHTVRHYGAGHAIMIADPRPVIASILRFVAPICAAWDG
jgi:pimeloyl-ACP methyl ester carboxylesterase